MYTLSLNPLLMVIAVVPALYLMLQVYKADRIEKEPWGVLIGLVLWGILSTAIAVALETAGTYVIAPLGEGSLAYNLVLYFIIVGLSEEFSKYIILKWRTWRSSNFNCTFDGVIYSVFISLGFALWENIQYVAIYGFETGIVRAFTAIPGHASFAVFMGVWYGMAKRYDFMGEPGKSKRCRRLALIIPTIMHGVYDFTATYTGLSLVFLAFIALMFFLAIRDVKMMSKHDKYIGTPLEESEMDNNLFNDL